MTSASVAAAHDDIIRARLHRAPVPGIPEIRLYTAHGGSRLSTLGTEAAPYWAFPWPGGVALARYVLDQPQVVAGRDVLDLGSGSGLVAIAAKMAGARKVEAADVDPFAAAAIALNAAENGVDIAPILADITALGAIPDTDLVLAGDVFYASEVADRMTRCLDRCGAAGLDVLVGDLRRPHLPCDRLREVASYALRDVGATAACATAVFTYLPSAAEETGEEPLLGRRSDGGR